MERTQKIDIMKTDSIAYRKRYLWGLLSVLIEEITECWGTVQGILLPSCKILPLEILRVQQGETGDCLMFSVIKAETT